MDVRPFTIAEAMAYKRARPMNRPEENATDANNWFEFVVDCAAR